MERWAYACEVQANRARDKLADTLVLDVWKKSLTEAKWNKRVLDVLRADYYVKALQFVRRDEPLLARRLVALWDEAERFSPPVALPNIADQSVAWALDQRNVDAEYHGRYECPQGTTAFTILVRAASARADRDVVFRFGPDSENVYVSGGSFFMRGKVELEGGVLSLTPVSWISQPDSGWKMVGLEGASTDKGESFSGRVKGPGCKTFAISRAATRRLAQPEGLTH